MAWVPYRSLFDAEDVEFWTAPTSFDDNRIVFEGVLLPDGYRNLFSAWCGPEDVLVRLVLEDGASADAALPDAVLNMGGNTTVAFPNAGVVEPFDHEAYVISNWEAGAVVAMRPQVPHFTDIEFTGTFQIYIWSEDPEPEPTGECFWTDLVNATQVCAGGPAPDPEPSGEMAFTGTYGRLIHVLDQFGGRHGGMCSDDLYAALLVAPYRVLVNGYAPGFNSDQVWCGEATPPAPDAPEWYLYEPVWLTRNENSLGTYYSISGGDPDPISTPGGYWLRVEVYATDETVTPQVFYGHYYWTWI